MSYSPPAFNCARCSKAHRHECRSVGMVTKCGDYEDSWKSAGFRLISVPEDEVGQDTGQRDILPFPLPIITQPQPA